MTRDLSDAYRLPAGEVLTALGADLHRGLTDQEATARLATYGHNEVAPEAAVPAWRRFLAQLKDVLVILLLVATAVSVVLWVYEDFFNSLQCIVKGHFVAAVSSSLLVPARH